MKKDDIFAALIFFTRLPWWRIHRVPDDSFKRIVGYWPLAGWVTGGVMACVYALANGLFHLTPAVALLLAFISRIFLTGALHEDGLADFFDGFGGGRSREQTLAVMKDSHIGTYGVLALVCYVVLWIMSVLSLTTAFSYDMSAQGTTVKVCIVLFTGDVLSKWCASQIVNFMPYARKEEDSKIKTIYERMSKRMFLINLAAGVGPLFLTVLTAKSYVNFFIHLWIAAIAPCATMYLLMLYMRRRIGGYTGDCCGAMFLLCELSYIITLNCLWMLL